MDLLVRVFTDYDELMDALFPPTLNMVETFCPCLDGVWGIRQEDCVCSTTLDGYVRELHRIDEMRGRIRQHKA